MKARKILALVLAVLMAATLGTAIFAATSEEDGTGSITVRNPAPGKTYTAYKLFDMTYDGEGHYAYTFDVMGGATTRFLSAMKQYAGRENSGFTVTKSNTDSVYTVDFTADFSAADFAAFLSDYLETWPDTILSVYPLENGTVDDLPLAYYFVTTDNGSLCNLTSTDPDAVIYDKNVPLVIEKTADDDDGTVLVGQEITYTVTGALPEDITGYTAFYYEISDTMSEGLTFSGSIRVLFGDDVVFDNGDGATVADPVGAYTAGSNGFTWRADLVGLEDHLGDAVTVIYTATVNGNAVERDGETNSATLRYSNDPADATSFCEDNPPAVVEVDTFNVDVIKVDSADDTATLAGAEFVLYREDGVEDLYYSYANGAVSWVSESEASVMTTGQNGKVSFDGLDAGTYYLVEKKAPLGFKKATDPFVIVLTLTDGATAGEKVLAASIDGVAMETDGDTMTATCTVANPAGTVLPETGGMGTTVLYVIGGILIAVAITVLVTKKRVGAK